VHEEVLSIIRGMGDPESIDGFVLTGQDWDEGVLGIAASRVVEDFGKPAVLISLAGDVGKGSGRSVRGVHLKEQLDKCESHLLRFGGHAQAVGFSIEPSRVAAFTDDLSGHLAAATSSLPAKPRLKIDAELALDECSIDLLDFLARCEPFGFGNKTPLWKISNVVVANETRIVGGSHLKLYLRDESGRTADAIRFNWDKRAVPPEALHGRVVDLAVTVKKGYYLRRYHAEMHVVDMREHEG
jgi:single-stranded-DNA-specific exonuclease